MLIRCYFPTVIDLKLKNQQNNNAVYARSNRCDGVIFAHYSHKPLVLRSGRFCVSIDRFQLFQDITCI